MVAPVVDHAEELKRLATCYRVCWDVWPEYVMAGSERRQVGFELELSATHAPGAVHPTPGCRHCRDVFAALVAIAGILPREKRPTRYDLQPYEPKIQYSDCRGYRPDVSLSIKIVHRGAGFDPVDACEQRCLHEIEDRLKELGACRGRWVDRKSQP